MTEDRNDPDEQRRQAEECLAGQPADEPELSPLSREDLRRLVHELRVHQIELEMQNEELRQTQEKLTDAHDRYVDLYDFSPIGYFIFGAKGLIREVNLSGARLLGMERGSVLNQPLARFVVPEDQDLFYHHQRQAFSTQTRQACELRMQKGNGAPFYAQLESVMTSDSRYHHGALRIAVTDITEHKQAETRDRLARDVLSRLNHPVSPTDTIHDLLLLIKQSTGIEAVGIRLREGDDFPYYQTSGFPEHFVQPERYLCAHDAAGEIVRDSQGNPVLECMCGNILCSRTNPQFPFFTEGGSFWINSTTDLLASTTEKDRQARTRNRCNGEGYESVALIPLREGNKVIGLLQLNDHRRDRFTLEMIRFFEGLGASIGIALQRQQAGEKLKKAHDELGLRVEERTAELQEINTQLRESEEHYRRLVESIPGILYRYSDQRGARYWSPRIEEILGFSPSQVAEKPRLWHDAIHLDDQPKVDRAIEDFAGGNPLNIEYRIQDARGNWHWLHDQSIGRYEGDGEVIIEGLAIDITVRRRLEEELIRLERLRARGEMATGISHNLNNLLNGIQAPAQILQRALDDPSLRKWADLIVQASQRAADLVRRLHHAVQDGEESLEAVDVNAGVEEAVATTRARWQEGTRVGDGAIEMVTGLETVPPIRGTSSGLHDALVNLILNAVDALPKGGRLILESRQVGDWVEVRVADTGVGMAEEVRRRVFEPFFTTKSDVGSGLGLYTVYATVTGWGGTIAVESAPGEGTRFRLRLPVWRDPKKGKTVEEEGTRRLKVLLVEDEEVMVETLMEYLGESCEMEVVRDGQDAVDGYVAGGYDVVLIDLLLPGMGGDQVASRLRQVDAGVVRVLVTGVELSADDPRLSAFDLWYQKPIDADHIDEMMEHVVQLRQQRVTELGAAPGC